MPAHPPLPPVSSIDIVVAFHRVGFEVTTVTTERVVMTRGDRTIVVERHKMHRPSEVLLLLRAARVTPEQFLDILIPAPSQESGVRHRTLGDSHDAGADDRGAEGKRSTTQR
jgi:hypothetical protein